MADGSIETSTNSPKIIQTPQITPSPVVREGNEGREVTSETESLLEKLKKNILGGMKFELVKKYFDSLEYIPEENKPYILGGILSGLNQRGIAIEGFENGKIKLKTGKQSLRKKLDIADHGETIRYQELINNYLKDGVITIKDINKALLYRTTEIDNYIQEGTDKKDLSTSDYARRLFEKYKIKISPDLAGKGLESIDFVKKEKNPAYKPDVQKIEKTPIEEFIEKIDKEGYEKLKQLINEAITDNQSDKEFLIAYIDDVYSNKRQGIDENYIKKYNESSDKIQRGILGELNQLSDEQKFAIGIKDSDDAKNIARKWKNNPLEALEEAFTNGGGLLGVIFGIIGRIFWGEEGLFGGFGLGMAIGGGGVAFAGEIVDNAMGAIDEKAGKPLSDLIKKYSSLFTENIGNLKKEELTNISTKLLNNQEFLKSDSSKLNIFTDGTKQEDIEKYFGSIGLVLNEKNKPYYKQIFKSYIEKRKKDGINPPIVGENISTYLTKISNTPEKPEEKKPKEKKVFKESLKELNITGKKVIIEVFKTDRYGNQKIETIEKLYNNPKQLEAVFKAYGQLEFFKKYEDGILQILKIVVDTQQDKTKNLREVLS